MTLHGTRLYVLGSNVYIEKEEKLWTLVTVFPKGLSYQMFTFSTLPSLY